MWNMVVVQIRPLIADDERCINKKMIMCQCSLALIMCCVGTQTSHLGGWGLVAFLCRNTHRWPWFFTAAARQGWLRCGMGMLDPAEHLHLRRQTCSNCCTYSGRTPGSFLFSHL